MTVPFLVGAVSPSKCSVQSLEDLAIPSLWEPPSALIWGEPLAMGKDGGMGFYFPTGLNRVFQVF